MITTPSPKYLEKIEATFGKHNTSSILKDFNRDNNSIFKDQQIFDAAFLYFCAGMVTVMSPDSHFNKEYKNEL